jgi:hypothetical protein
MSCSARNVDCLALKMDVICSFQTSVTVFQRTRRNISEGLNPHQHCCYNFKSFVFLLIDSNLWENLVRPSSG